VTYVSGRDRVKAIGSSSCLLLRYGEAVMFDPTILLSQ
jgi:hypothetical protein